MRLAVTGRLDALDAEARDRLLRRGSDPDSRVAAETAAIIARVRRSGDAALFELAAQFDRVRLASLEVPRSACLRARDALRPELRVALEQAAANIEVWHRAQLPAPLCLEAVPGVRLTRRADPLSCVGVYAPGGRAAYPSSVLMGVVPARAAGVGEVIVCSPPGAGGEPPAITLAACALAGVDRVFALGGAGAIAALALGTATVPRVDRIVGPGNAFVSEAKRQLQGEVGIDSPAGPSELLVIADDAADAVRLAAELFAQAEHDAAAAVVLIATNEPLLLAVQEELEQLLNTQSRGDVVRSAFAARGALLFAPDMSGALRFARDYAPEHLRLAVRDAAAWLPHVRNAGTIFVGRSSSVVFGDYLTGANHVLPTAGAARFFSGLNIHDFLRWTTVQEVSEAAAAALAGPAASLAEAEGLPGHALAARLHTAQPAGTPSTARTPAPLHNPVRPVARPAYREISLYDPMREPCAVDLSDNTSLFGIAPAVRRALTGIGDDSVTRYPSVYARRLCDAAARRWGIDASCITTGCGSDDVIDAAVRAFCEPGDRVVFPWPTFGVVPLFARMNGTLPIPVQRTVDLGLDTRGLLDAGGRLLYLCRPDNPTGATVARTGVADLVAAFRGIVLIDEAYADFADDDVLDIAVASSNAVVVRTLSKAYGMAGLRVGFAIGPAALVREIEKARGPYKVSTVAERAALAALADTSGWRERCVNQVRDNRDRLVAELRTGGYDALPSHGNFVLVRLPDGSASAESVTRRLRPRASACARLPRFPCSANACVSPSDRGRCSSCSWKRSPPYSRPKPQMGWSRDRHRHCRLWRRQSALAVQGAGAAG